MMSITAPQTNRQYRHYPRRDVAWVDWVTGAGVGPSGSPFKVTGRGSVQALLSHMDRPVSHVVMLTTPPGKGRDALREWAYGSAGKGPRGLGDGWEHGAHYWPDSGSPVLRYRRVDGTGQVDVHLAESWFGDEPVTPAGGRQALADVAQALAARCRGAQMLTTAVQTGLGSIDRMCDTDRTPWPAEYQDVVRLGSGQHRMEWVAEGRTLPAVVEMDMHLAYGALAWGLGAGPPVLLREVTPGTRGLFCARTTVPATWDRPYGLLGCKRAEGGWWWPADPGYTFTTWADGAELAVAAAQGWTFETVAGYGPEDPTAKPLDRWAAEMCGMADLFDRSRNVLAYTATRAIMVQAIGGLVARPGVVYRTLPAVEAMDIPDGHIPGTVRFVGDVVTWAEETPVNRGDLAHPEWAAQIWGRCRARLLWKRDGTGVLNLHPDDTLGFRGDAVYLTCAPAWPYSGHRAGQWRPKWGADGPIHPITSLGAYDRWKRQQKAASR